MPSASNIYGFKDSESDIDDDHEYNVCCVCDQRQPPSPNMNDHPHLKKAGANATYADIGSNLHSATKREL
ncbi:hypothetical protein DPMN_060074 [Dreissena polymorpha]|uniref:Uncharacterized protein n=1 Tax=Dreissena polymorpha TaxID=45954 RepID=A0A9D4HHT7_DREPO|nr:hypothetical protein DPMN_060074 [Dreissena polymorpha]